LRLAEKAGIASRQTEKPKGTVMKRLCVLVFALFLCAGCASDRDKGQWDEFWKDMRGDNMKMRGFGEGGSTASHD
jgi:hypothetical protein